MKIEKFRDSLVFDASLSMYPTILTTHTKGDTSYPDVASTYFGIVISGEVSLVRQGAPKMTLGVGMYFSSVGSFTLSGSGEVVIIRRIGYRGLFTAGGPVEKSGRLVYIDNCTTSILIPPARMGEPVLNLLVFPPNVEQTMHIHPTIRMGAVLSGQGKCITPKSAPVDLAEKDVFYLPEAAAHCFYSGENGLAILAYHPDSEGGPTDEDHPMLNRTYTKF
ncbi:MAG: cupin domain-containing protein [Bacillota bacterium]